MCVLCFFTYLVLRPSAHLPGPQRTVCLCLIVSPLRACPCVRVCLCLCVCVCPRAYVRVVFLPFTLLPLKRHQPVVRKDRKARFSPSSALKPQPLAYPPPHQCPCRPPTPCVTSLGLRERTAFWGGREWRNYRMPVENGGRRGPYNCGAQLAAVPAVPSPLSSCPRTETHSARPAIFPLSADASLIPFFVVFSLFLVQAVCGLLPPSPDFSLTKRPSLFIVALYAPCAARTPHLLRDTHALPHTHTYTERERETRRHTQLEMPVFSRSWTSRGSRENCAEVRREGRCTGRASLTFYRPHYA